MDTTAPEARSAAVTKAVLRDSVVAVWGSIVRTDAWAPALVTLTWCGPASPLHAVTASRSHAARLTRLDRNMGLELEVGVDLAWISSGDEVQALRRSRRTGVLVVSSLEQHLDIA